MGRDMADNILGIHHITAISGNPQDDVNFYSGVLGLRLVKKTVNFDDPGTYHLYFGDEGGNPGTIWTLFPWGTQGLKGRIGNGQVSTTAFSIPQNAMAYWIERLSQYRVAFHGPESRFDEEVLYFSDSSGLQFELVASANDSRTGWINGPIPADYAIKGFYQVSLSVASYERTAGLLTETLEFDLAEESGNRMRYKIGSGDGGKIVDLICEPNRNYGTIGIGTVHHIAFRTPSEQSQLSLREEISMLGYDVTSVMDRNYFKSIYFREPGHILFEIATDPPGFTVDENKAELGENLMLPAWFEKQRADITSRLFPLSSPEITAEINQE
jgi:glyoxalase family protein